MSYGLANTNRFMLGAASILLGPQADLFNMTRATNSIGMVKNFSLVTEPSFADLTQGVKNTLVYSVMNGHTARVSAELYEYTPKNLAYLASLNGGTFTPSTNIETTVATAVAGAPGSPATSVLVASGTGFAIGDWILIQSATQVDDAIVTKVTAVVTNTLTVAPGVGRAFSVGATVRRMNYTAIAEKTDPPFFSALVLGQLANGDEIALALPKVRITSGLNLTFSSDDYGNMPLEMAIFDLVSTDPNFATFGPTPAAILS